MTAIVGGGFAAYFLAWRYLMAAQPFVLFDDGRAGASHIAAGIVNPVILKRFNVVADVDVQLQSLQEFNSEFQKFFGEEVFLAEPVLRIFHDEKEIEIWQRKCTQKKLRPFLNPNTTQCRIAKHVYRAGEVKQSGRFAVQRFFDCIGDYLSAKGLRRNELFDSDRVVLKDGSAHYVPSGETFNTIVFCEGVDVARNKFFNYLPIQPNKGHRLLLRPNNAIIRNKIIKKKYFLFAESQDAYYYGGTYDRFGKGDQLDTHAVEDLTDSYRDLTGINLDTKDYQVNFAYRPTVGDRKPIIGTHPMHPSLAVFNGLGARGVLNGCHYSQLLFDHVVHGSDLPVDVSVNRFDQLLHP